MTKEDMMLELVKEIRENQIKMGQDVAVLNHVTSTMEDIKTDMAVLKAKHNTGNLSERVCAGVAILALLVSVTVAVTSCKEHKNASNGRYPGGSTIRKYR
jgi:hypothetical protein